MAACDAAIALTMRRDKLLPAAAIALSVSRDEMRERAHGRSAKAMDRKLSPATNVNRCRIHKLEPLFCAPAKPELKAPTDIHTRNYIY